VATDPRVKAFLNIDSNLTRYSKICFDIRLWNCRFCGQRRQCDTAYQTIFLNILANSSVMQILLKYLVTDSQWWAVSMKQLTNGGRCQWHRLPLVGDINNTTDQRWAVSTTPLTTGVNDTDYQYWHRWVTDHGDPICAKGQSHEIFNLWFFSSNDTPWSTGSWVKAVSNIDSYSRRYSTTKIANFQFYFTAVG
jgi:hypothetical protein